MFLCQRCQTLIIQHTSFKSQNTSTLGKKVVKIGQKIEWGRDRHKTFLEFLGL